MGTSRQLSSREVSSKLIAVLTPLAPQGVEVGEATDLVTDLELDSLKVMGVLEQLEDGFDISIPINILPDVRTVGDLVQQIERIMGND